MNERAWERILEAVRLLSKEHGVEIPEGLIVTTGNIWERDAQKRNALNEFLEEVRVSELDPFELDMPVEDIANALDVLVLKLNEDEQLQAESEEE